MRRILALVLVTLLSACDAPSGVTTPPTERETAAASEELLSALSRARSHHAQADLYLAEGDTGAAAGALEKILLVPFPAGPEGEDTLLDARARLARLYLKAERLDDADRVLDTGLAGPQRGSFFLANLWAVSGERHEARARRLQSADPEAAKQARRAALLAYEESIRLNTELQERLHGSRRAK